MTENVTKLHVKVQECLKENDVNGAVDAYKEILKLDEYNVNALHGLGVLNLREGEYEAAYKVLSMAAERKPNAPDIALNLGYVLSKGGRRHQALLEFQRATKYCGADPQLCSALAGAFVELYEPDGALQILDRLTALTPQDQVLMAQAYGIKGAWSEAVRVLHRLANDLPEEVVVLSELTKAAVNLGDYRVAIDAYERILKARTPSAYDYVKFAELLLLARDKGRANQALKIAQDLGDDSVALWVLKAKMAYFRNADDEALRCIDVVNDLAAANGDAWSLKAELTPVDNVKSQLLELERLLDDSDALAKKGFHEKSQLYFAAATLAQKSQNYESAAHYLRAANEIRMNEQLRLHAVYDGEKAKQRREQIQKSYNQETMASASAEPQSGLNLKPIFIVGMPRSGASVIEAILSRCAGVQTLGKQQAISMIASDYDQYITAGQMPKPCRVSVKQWQAMRQAYLDKIIDLQKNTFVDTTPLNHQHVGLILKLFPEAKVIYVKRARNDVALSIYRSVFPLNVNYANWLVDVMHAVDAAQESMSYWSGLNLSQVHEVDYESLVSEPELYAKQLVTFCNLTWKADLLNSSNDTDNICTVQERQAQGELHQNSVGKWSHYSPYMPEFSA